MTGHTPVYQRVLGEDWLRLPEVTRQLHSPAPVSMFEGTADIEGAEHPLATLIAGRAGLPQSGADVPARISVSMDGDTEIITRDYGGTVFETRQSAVSTPRGMRLREQVGSVVFTLRLEAGPHGLDFHQESATVMGVPLPGVVRPILRAQERADAGEHLFDVEVALPALGRLVRYRGRLRPVDAQPGPRLPDPVKRQV